MTTSTRARRVRGALVAVTALTLGMSLGATAPAGAAGANAAQNQAASWLADQPTDGLVYNDQFEFDDYGLTVDHGLALQALGRQGSTVEEIADAISENIDSYTTGVDFGSEDVYAGAVAKSLAFLTAAGRDGEDVAGVNLKRRLNQLVTREGRSTGRIADVSEFGDFANTLGQAYAAQALTATGSGQRKKVIRFLLKQQCGQGYFRLSFDEDKDANNQGCNDKNAETTSQPSVDATAIAMLALLETDRLGRKVQVAIGDAAGWLTRVQDEDGGFSGAPPTDAPNSNSTGLAAWALGSVRACREARDAARWVQALKVDGRTGGALAEEKGAIAYDSAAFEAGLEEGITTETRDQWRRAASQAAPAMDYLKLPQCRRG